MCFPSKRQKNLLSDDTTKKPAPEAIKAQEPVAAQPSTAPSNPTEPTPAPTTATTTTADMAGPKIAIVIYSMYGHVAKGNCYLLQASVQI